MHVFFYIFLSLITFFSSSCFAFVTDWQYNQNSKARIRFISVENDKLTGIMELQLDDGWYTYYKEPGDFGIPTELMVLNNNQVTVYWPAYETVAAACELGDDFVSNIYREKVFLPLEFKMPISDVHLKLNYGICNNVCIPLSIVFKFRKPEKIFSDENSKFLLKTIQKSIVADETFNSQS